MIKSASAKTMRGARRTEVTIKKIAAQAGFTPKNAKNLLKTN
jgi:hypothetical protein